MKKMVKKKIIKWLDAGVVYPIADSDWVSPIQCVFKKGDVTVVSNNNKKLISTRIVTSWCLSFIDHLSLPFIDQLFDRLTINEFYCFFFFFLQLFRI